MNKHGASGWDLLEVVWEGEWEVASLKEVSKAERQTSRNRNRTAR